MRGEFRALAGQVLRLVDTEGDINKINDYFSYEHFYVLYCKFWELDTDHDFLLDRDDGCIKIWRRLQNMAAAVTRYSGGGYKI